jgi:hypothetical protein
VQATAYKVGDDVVFGPGRFAPNTSLGRRLLVHELTHVVQGARDPRPAVGELRIGDPAAPEESEANRVANALGECLPTLISNGMTTALRRACLPATTCAAASGSLSTFVQQQSSDPTNRSRRDRRTAACRPAIPDAACSRVPAAAPPTACTADGHGRRATQLETLLRGHGAHRLAFIHGVFVDRDIESGYGAVTSACECFTPPINGGGKACVSVPESLELEAATFNASPSPTVGGQPREDWLLQTLQTLTHETEHGRFEGSPPVASSTTACAEGDIHGELSEIAATMSEFVVLVRFLDRTRAPAPDRRTRLDSYFNYAIANPDEGIGGNMRQIRCRCECGDADEYVRRTVALATASWTPAERARFNAEMHDPRWSSHDLRWPIAAPTPPTPPTSPPVPAPAPPVSASPPAAPPMPPPFPELP